MQIIDKYLMDYLKPALEFHNVNEEYLAFTLSIVKKQMISLLQRWDDKKFRETVLLIGAEEGLFYQPKVDSAISCFVVVTIRNSPLETYQSDSFAKAGLIKPLNSFEVRIITQEALNYFAKQDFDVLCKQAKLEQSENIYEKLQKQYPVAWTALQVLATMRNKEASYKELECKPYIPETIMKEIDKCNDIALLLSPVVDGYDCLYDKELIGLLVKMIRNDISVFLTGSFKSITRNVEKLMQIIECVLTHEKALVLSNFYLENGHVERRKNLLRAEHTNVESHSNLTNLSGLGYRHWKALNEMKK